MLLLRILRNALMYPKIIDYGFYKKTKTQKNIKTTKT